jgi:hypothetical protein
MLCNSRNCNSELLRKIERELNNEIFADLMLEDLTKNYESLGH